MERKKQISVEEKEIERKDKELTATVKRPAEAESYKVQTLAQGQRYFLNLGIILLFHIAEYSGDSIFLKICIMNCN